MKRAVFALVAILFLLSVLSITGLIQPIKAAGTPIYINADGSISPSNAPIHSADNITYTLTGNITSNADGVVIERGNIVLNGAGYTVTGIGNGRGILLENMGNVTVRNMMITNLALGILLVSSSNCTLSGNNVTANSNIGIYLNSSSSNTLSGNNVTNNGCGIFLGSSSNNTLSSNNAANNTWGTYLDSTSNNTIYHNNFMNNTSQVYSSNSTNVWDNGVEGNYWSDYSGTDANHDGIGDTPYIIDVNNTDYFPLMGTFQCFNVTVPGHTVQFEEVDIISNCTIGKRIYFVLADDVRSPTGMVTFLLLQGFVGQNGTVSFCRITLPNDILNTTSYHVGTWLQYEYGSLPIAKVISSNGTHTTLYYTCDLPISDPWGGGVVIIPEFPSFLVLPLFMIMTLLAVITYKRRTRRQFHKAYVLIPTITHEQKRHPEYD